ncbi:hypothetical protein FRC07_001986 [Ceratobasidium sp. 392]|nr:hypothetical protein FRC07_001986 [Ceratobasidium sp. 392]
MTNKASTLLRTRKRRKSKREDPYPDLVLERCYFTEIPLELLANILQYVYPIDLLALSSTNNYFRKTLRDAQQNHIWKSSRERFPHAILPRPVRLTEIELATLLFGTGPCSNYPLSSNRSVWTTPRYEVSDLVYGILPSEKLYLMHETGLAYCRQRDAVAVIADICAGLRKSELESKYNTTFEQTQQYNEFLKRTRSTLNHLAHARKSKESEIQRFAKHKLAKYKFHSAWLENSATYMSERRRLSRSYQVLDDKGKYVELYKELLWDTVPPRTATDNPDKPRQTIGELIVHEMQVMDDAAQRRQSEASMRKTREAVEQHWHQLKNLSGPAGSIIPRLNEFNSLPVVNALLKPKATDGEAGNLNAKDSTLSKLVKSDVTTWEERTCAQFRKILQVPIPKKNQAPEPGIVPPLDRVTSLFECAKCKSVGLSLAQEGTLTFRSAVKHQCKNAPSKRFQWKPDSFQPDNVGIQISRFAVVASGRTEARTTRQDMDDLGPCFLCVKCPNPIYLTFGNLVRILYVLPAIQELTIVFGEQIGHMKRHGISDPNGTFAYQTAPPNVDVKLLSSSKGMVEARRRGAKKGHNSNPGSQDFFICLHCNKPLLWNALVSHVKAK